MKFYIVGILLFILNIKNANGNNISKYCKFSDSDLKILDYSLINQDFNINLLSRIENTDLKESLVLLSIASNKSNLNYSKIEEYMDYNLLYNFLNSNILSYYSFEIISRNKNYQDIVDLINLYLKINNNLHSKLHILKYTQNESKKLSNIFTNKLVNEIFELHNIDNIETLKYLYQNYQNNLTQKAIYLQFIINLQSKNKKNADYLFNKINNKDIKLKAKKDLNFYGLYNQKRRDKKKLYSFFGNSEYVDLSLLLIEDDLKKEYEILQSRNKLELNPSKWFQKLFKVSRLILNMNDIKERYQMAYNLMNKEIILQIDDFQRQQWLLGYLALKNNNFKASEEHFLSYLNTSMYSQTKAKGEYWLSILYESIGNFEKSYEHKKNSSKYPLSFYGQIAIEDLKLNLDQIIDSVINEFENISKLENENICKNKIFLASYFANKLKNTKLSIEFAKKFIETEKNIDVALRGLKIYEENFEIDITRILGKYATNFNIGLRESSYPKLDAVLNPFIKAIIRQESGLKSNQISHKGATGTMQLIPSTAKIVAKELGIKYDYYLLLTDHKYNILLGTKYLEKCLNDYGNHKVLALICYNAGPARVNSWIKKFGDIRDFKTRREIAEWIEILPISETRDYIKKIMETEIVYEMIDNGITSEDSIEIKY